MLFSKVNSSHFRVRAVFCVSQQQAVCGGWTDNDCRLLRHRERRVETDIGDEGEEDGVWGRGNKWLYLRNRWILVLQRDLPSKHREI